MNDSQFLSAFENDLKPLISLKDIIISISEYTNQRPDQIADNLEHLLFGFRQNRQYVNSFCHCTIWDQTGSQRTIYEPIENNFKDAFNHIKGFLKDVIILNSFDIDGLDKIFVRRKEFAQRVKTSEITVLAKMPNKPENGTSKVRDDYVSVYDFLEFSRSKYDSYEEAVSDILSLLKHNNINLYEFIEKGFKPRIKRFNSPTFRDCLESVKARGGYYNPLDDEIPF
ncbi:hypothetical protein ACUHGC_02480 [Testudinibacter sp. P27/CKL/0425]